MVVQGGGKGGEGESQELGLGEETDVHDGESDRRWMPAMALVEQRRRIFFLLFFFAFLVFVNLLFFFFSSLDFSWCKWIKERFFLKKNLYLYLRRRRSKGRKKNII